MTRADTIRALHDSICRFFAHRHRDRCHIWAAIERAYDVGASAEREACAALTEERAANLLRVGGGVSIESQVHALRALGHVIRARGKDLAG
jgi:hypothetical protein